MDRDKEYYMKTAPLMVLEDTSQVKDIKESRAPSDVIDGVYRIKTYIKPDDWAHMWSVNRGSIHSLPFDQPFQVASQRTGRDWNITNRVFMGQVASCNLSCDYCYVDQDGFLGKGENPSVREVSSKEYVDAYASYLKRGLNSTGEYPAGVLRYSGGEPFLFQEWLAESVEYAVSLTPWMNGGVNANHYIWIDTNLTLSPSDELIRSLTYSSNRVGVCGCFKPDQCDIDDQLMVVNDLVKAGVDLYLYYPSYGGSDVDMAVALEGLSEIHPNLPLRMKVIGIRWGYSAMKDRRGMVSADEAIRSETERKHLWEKYILTACDHELIHLPSHQIPIG